MKRKNVLFFLTLLVTIPVFFVAGFSVVLIHELINSSVQKQIQPFQKQLSELLWEQFSMHASALETLKSNRESLSNIESVGFKGISQINFYKKNFKLEKSYFRGSTSKFELFTPPRNSEISLDSKKARVGFYLEIEPQKVSFVYLTYRSPSPGKQESGFIETLSTLHQAELLAEAKKSNMVYLLANSDFTHFITNLSHHEALTQTTFPTQSGENLKTLLKNFNFQNPTETSSIESLQPWTVLGRKFLVSTSKLQLGEENLLLLVGMPSEASQNWKSHLSFQMLIFSLSVAGVGLGFAWLLSRIFLRNPREDFRI